MKLNNNILMTTTVRFLERIKILPPQRISKIKYFLKFKKKLDLQNPKNLNEKILWLSHNTDTSKWTELADKYRVREYVKSCGLEHLLVKLYGVYDSAEDIKIDKLPQSFVLKTNNGCGTVILVEDKSKLDIQQTKKTLNKWLKIPFGILSAEPHYRRIKPCITAEEYLKEENPISTSLIDYKIWCFNEIPYYAFIGCNRDIQNHKVDFNLYEVDGWISKEEFMSENFKNTINIPQPQHLHEMLDAAKILSKEFPIIRVDFYEVQGKIYFGELTFTSNGGLMSYFTSECLQVMGEKVKLPI